MTTRNVTQFGLIIFGLFFGFLRAGAQDYFRLPDNLSKGMYLTSDNQERIASIEDIDDKSGGMDELLVSVPSNTTLTCVGPKTDFVNKKANAITDPSQLTPFLNSTNNALQANGEGKILASLHRDAQGRLCFKALTGQYIAVDKETDRPAIKSPARRDYLIKAN